MSQRIRDFVDSAPIPFPERTWKRQRSLWEAEQVANAPADEVLAMRLSGPAILTEIEELNYRNVTTIVVERKLSRYEELEGKLSAHQHNSQVQIWQGDFHYLCRLHMKSGSFDNKAVWLDADYTGTFDKMIKDGFAAKWQEIIEIASNRPIEYLFITQTFARRDSRKPREEWQNKLLPALLKDNGFAVEKQIVDYGAPRLGLACMSTGFYQCKQT